MDGVKPNGKRTKGDCSNIFVCEVCTEQFPNELAAKEHCATHAKSAINEMQMPDVSVPDDNCCKVCKVQFKRKARLKKHMETMHQNELQAIDVIDVQTIQDAVPHRKYYLCNVCNQLFDSEIKYMEHSNCDSRTEVKNVTGIPIEADTGYLSGKETTDDVRCSSLVENIVSFEVYINMRFNCL